MNDNEREYHAEVTAIITADTFEAVVDLGFNVSTRTLISVDGYDAPKPDSDTGASERIAGLAALCRASELLTMHDQPIKVIPRKRHCYGRWYCTVKLASGADYGDQMIAEGRVKQSAGVR